MFKRNHNSAGARISLIIALIAGLVGVVPVTAETNSEKAAQSPAGSLDPSFDGDGLVTTPSGSAFSVAIQPDGKIVVAGQSANGDFLVARYNSDGSPDASFDSDGMVTTDFG